MRRSAFTLIELLVVVAIIVALLAILMPSMNKAIAVSQSAVCSSNLHQWSIAQMNYAVDYFGSFPYYTSNNTPFALIRPYWQVEGMKYCPSAASPYTTPALGGAVTGGAAYAYVEARYDTNGDGIRDHEIGSLTYNGMCNVYNAWPNGAGVGHIPPSNYISNIRDTDSRVPVMGDGGWTAGLPGATFSAGDQPDPTEFSPTTSAISWGLPRWAIRRHFARRINLGLADGHVESTDLPGIWTNYRWHRNYQLGQPAPTIPWL